MPRQTPPERIAEYTKPDGTILRARIEWRRADGVWGVDLRHLNRGRPRLAEPKAGLTKSDVVAAKRLAVEELRAIAGGKVSGTRAALVAPMEHATAYVSRKEDFKAMTARTAADAWRAIDRCWTILHEDLGLTAWDQVQRPHITTLVDGLRSRVFDGKRLGQNSIRNHLNYLKGFMKAAEDAGIVKASPIHRHTAVPKADTSYVRDWLEPAELGLLLEVSFAGRKNYPHNACQEWPEILATEAYTGARETEVLGLLVRDISLTGGLHGAGTIRYEKNTHRRVKNPSSARLVSMWPAHGAIMAAYLKRAKLPQDSLAFPNRKGKKWSSLHASMKRDLKAAKIEKAITDHSMRHSYISARARMYTRQIEGNRIVERATHLKDIILEVGHGSDRMARTVYDHSSPHPVEGWTELNYATALELLRKGLGARPRRAAATRAKRSSASRSSTVRTGATLPTKRKSAAR